MNAVREDFDAIAMAANAIEAGKDVPVTKIQVAPDDKEVECEQVEVDTKETKCPAPEIVSDVAEIWSFYFVHVVPN